MAKAQPLPKDNLKMAFDVQYVGFSLISTDPSLFDQTMCYMILRQLVDRQVARFEKSKKEAPAQLAKLQLWDNGNMGISVQEAGKLAVSSGGGERTGGRQLSRRWNFSRVVMLFHEQPKETAHSCCVGILEAEWAPAPEKCGACHVVLFQSKEDGVAFKSSLVATTGTKADKLPVSHSTSTLDKRKTLSAKSINAGHANTDAVSISTASTTSTRSRLSSISSMLRRPSPSGSNSSTPAQSLTRKALGGEVVLEFVKPSYIHDTLEGQIVKPARVRGSVKDYFTDDDAPILTPSLKPAHPKTASAKMPPRQKDPSQSHAKHPPRSRGSVLRRELSNLAVHKPVRIGQDPRANDFIVGTPGSLLML